MHTMPKGRGEGVVLERNGYRDFSVKRLGRPKGRMGGVVLLRDGYHVSCPCFTRYKLQ